LVIEAAARFEKAREAAVLARSGAAKMRMARIVAANPGMAKAFAALVKAELESRRDKRT